MAEPSNAPMSNRARINDAISTTEEGLSPSRSAYGSEEDHDYDRPVNESIRDYNQGRLVDRNRQDDISGGRSSTATRTPFTNKIPVVRVVGGHFRTCTRRLVMFWRKDTTTPTRIILVLIGVLLLGVLVVLIAIAALYIKLKKSPVGPKSFLSNITISTKPDASAPPMQDSSLGIAPANFSNFFAPASSVSLQTLLVYNAGNNTVCIKGREVGQPWQTNVQCISGLDMMDKSPIAVLDWIGGPSVYWISKNKTLTGIDHVPTGNTWKISSVASQNRQTSNTTQLQAVTWLYGTSAWLYFQDVDLQIREFGLDDYRDSTWRDGINGPLGPAEVKSGIAVMRYANGGNEILELYWQTAHNAIKGRVFSDKVWTSDVYTVTNSTTYSVGTSASDVDETSSLSGTMVGTTALLTYISTDGYVTVQYRDTNSTVDYSAFSEPQKVFLGDGMLRSGLSSTGADGSPDIVVVKGQSIWQITADDVASVNWTTTQVS